MHLTSAFAVHSFSTMLLPPHFVSTELQALQPPGASTSPVLEKVFGPQDGAPLHVRSSDTEHGDFTP